MEEIISIDENQLGDVIAIIPAYNEERNIKKTIETLPTFVNHVVIVNDGSKDNTSEEIMGANRERKYILEFDKNNGKGKAIISGLKWIKDNFRRLNGKTAIVLVDGDGQMDPSFMRDLVDPIFSKDVDFVKATRFKNREHYENMPKFRVIGNKILRILNWISSGQWNITDPQNGYFAMSFNAMKMLNLNEIDTSYFFENSILIQTGIKRLLVSEISIPAIYNIGENSTIKYYNFIPETSIKLFLGWIKRQMKTCNKNLYRLISSISVIGITFSILFSFFFLFFVAIKSFIFSIGLSIVFFFVSVFFDFVDYKQRINEPTSIKSI